MTGRTAVGVVLVAVLCLSLVAPSMAAAEETETADEFLVAFNEMSETDAFLEYSEFELLRSQAVIESQTGEFTDADRERMAELLAALEAFEEAYDHAQAGDREAAIDRADDVDEHLSALRDQGDARNAQLGQVALSRFYEAQAGELYEEAQAVPTTPERIEMQRTAAAAFETAGATERYSMITVETEELASRYESDVERMDDADAAAGAFLDDCTEVCTDLGAAVLAGGEAFDRYADAQAAHADATAAEEIAAEHGMADRESELAEQSAAAFDALVTTALASSIVVFAYTLVFVLVTVAVTSRIGAWERDVRAARVPEIATVEEVTDG